MWRPEDLLHWKFRLFNHVPKNKIQRFSTRTWFYWIFFNFDDCLCFLFQKKIRPLGKHSPNFRLIWWTGSPVGEMPYSKFDLKKKIIKTTQQHLSWLTRWTVRPVTQVWLPDETGWRIVSPFFWVTRLCCVVHECMFRPCVFSTHWDRCAR